MVITQETLIKAAQQAIQWVYNHTLPLNGIQVSSTKLYPYPEVTGYLVPTLLAYNQVNLAKRYLDFLSWIQQPNGAFVGTDGQEHFFDTAQVLRGFNAGYIKWGQYKEQIEKVCDYLLSQMGSNGEVQTQYKDDKINGVILFGLPPLMKAAEIFRKKKYAKYANATKDYFQRKPEILNPNLLSHYSAYIVDGFIEMQESDFVFPFTKKYFEKQKSSGGITGTPYTPWICSTGVAQFAIIAYKLHMNQQGDDCLKWLLSHQNRSGGFWGSYGLAKNYFPFEEISWTIKFFLDAIQIKLGESCIKHNFSDNQSKDRGKMNIENNTLNRLDQEKWHDVLLGHPIKLVSKARKAVKIKKLATSIRQNDFPLWARPLLEYTSPGDIVVELGSGTGILCAILGKYNRRPILWDFSQSNLDFSKDLFKCLSLKPHTVCCDILKKFPAADRSVDWVFSSGVLEHFSDSEIEFVMQESFRICRKGVISLVPNAKSIAYRLGKNNLELSGHWKYGYEDPKYSLHWAFEKVGLQKIKEFDIDPYLSIEFLPKGKQQKQFRRFLKSLSPIELDQLQQGYLLCTIGHKDNIEPPSA